MRGDVTCVNNDNEVSEVKWVSQAALRELLSDADAGKCTVSPWFRLICEHMLFDWWGKLEAGTLDPTVDGVKGVRRMELGDIDPRTGRRPQQG